MSNEITENTTKAKALVTKSVSMPAELFQQANAKIEGDEELDWSKYVRRLIRQDLSQPESKEVAA